jgi:hypothetical protein
VSNGVYVKNSTNLLLCLAEERSADRYAGIVDQDCRITILFADHFGNGTDFSRLADITLVVVHI